MPITEEDIQTEQETNKKYLQVRYTNKNLELIQKLTDEFGYDGDYEKTLMLALGAIKRLSEDGIVTLKEHEK